MKLRVSRERRQRALVWAGVLSVEISASDFCIASENHVHLSQLPENATHTLCCNSWEMLVLSLLPFDEVPPPVDSYGAWA